jgi:hypothetical protein
MRTAGADVDERVEMLLVGYRPPLRWYDHPATRKQLTAFRREGFEMPPDLTEGEVAHVLSRCDLRTLARLRALPRAPPFKRKPARDESPPATVAWRIRTMEMLL